MSPFERKFENINGIDRDATASVFADLKRRIQRGDPIAIYEAILLVSSGSVQMPDWLSEELLKVIADHHLGKKPSWKGVGNKPLIVIRRRIERDIKRRAVISVRKWIKNKDAHEGMPTRCIRAWYLQRIHHNKFKTNEDAYRFACFGLRGNRLRESGPTIKCSARTLRRVFEDKKHQDTPEVPGRIATVFGIKDPDDFFGTNLTMPLHLL